MSATAKDVRLLDALHGIALHLAIELEAAGFPDVPHVARALAMAADVLRENAWPVPEPVDEVVSAYAQGTGFDVG